MMNKKSKWSKYDTLIDSALMESVNATDASVASMIQDINNLSLESKERSQLRTYILLRRRKLSLNSDEESAKVISGANVGDKKSWDEKDENASWSYEGSTCIINLEQAIRFSGVDMTKWEVERHVFNSWDVTMKIDDVPIKKTNYQVKVWFRRKDELVIIKPEFRNIEVKAGKASQMWIIAGCIHRPFHDKKLWDRFISFLKHNKKDITGIILDGDYLDLRSLSTHEEWIPDGVDLSYEYSDGAQGINDIENALNKDVDKIYLYGNHEDRFFRDKKSIRKYGSSLPSPHEAMELDKKGWEIITDWKNGYVTLGNNLDVFHGTKVGTNATKDQLQAIPTRSHIFFHTHRFGVSSNQTNSAYNGGCMIDFNHDVFKYTDRGIREAWTHGFIVAYIDSQGNNYVYPIKVAQDGSFFFKGVVY